MILIIEDDADTRAYIRCVVEPLGYELNEAKDVEEGLKKFTEMSAELVITDIVMPGKNGFQCIDEIRKLNKDVPVIAMTSNIHGRADDYLLMCKNLGANLVMYKPLTVEKVTSSVTQLYPLDGDMSNVGS